VISSTHVIARDIMSRLAYGICLLIMPKWLSNFYLPAAKMIVNFLITCLLQNWFSTFYLPATGKPCGRNGAWFDTNLSTSRLSTRSVKKLPFCSNGKSFLALK